MTQRVGSQLKQTLALPLKNKHKLFHVKQFAF
jgi:hypothetical protein